MSKAFIALDNGTSGTWAMVAPNYSLFCFTPIRNVLSYTKEEKHTNRVDWRKAVRILTLWLGVCKAHGWGVEVIMERPMINPQRWTATLNATRCLEACSICLEMVNLEYTFVDSKAWQKALLPNIKGSDFLKDASKNLGVVLFPEFEREIGKHKDADALLIAQWMMERHHGKHIVEEKSKRKRKK